MKTTEELNALKEEIKVMKAKLAELTEEELEQVTGGLKQMTDSEQSHPYIEYLPISNIPPFIE